MATSPGHKKWPDHHVTESHMKHHVGVFYKNIKIAETTDPILLQEDNHPDRYYIPRQDVHMELLRRTTESSECPFKGLAHYYSIHSEDGDAENAVWTYEQPYDEHKDIKDRLAFYTEKVDGLEVRDLQS